MEENQQNKRWMDRHGITVFLLACFGFSWGLWFLVMMSSAGWIPIRVPLNPYGSFGPAFAAVLTLWIRGGRPAVNRLLRSAFRFRAKPRWYLFSLLSPLGLSIIALIEYSVTAKAFPAPHLDQWYMVLPIALLILVLGGPLGEEIGWRGFLLPELLKRYSSLTAACIVGIFWFVWHLPLFWLEGSSQQGVPIPPYLFWIITESILFAWLYNRTGGNVWVAILFHTGINVTYYCIPFVFPEADASKLFHYSFLGWTAVLAVFLVILHGKDLGRSKVSRLDHP
jgi:CAAX protease family protein